MTEYTLGFVFNISLAEVLLITRNKHAFHSHKANGLGGKIIIGESPKECIVREVNEESGIETKEDDWKFMGIINGTSWKVWVFATTTKKQEQFPTISEGQVSWHNCKNLPNNIVSNLSWIVPFCIDKLSEPSLQSFVAWYAGEKIQSS